MMRVFGPVWTVPIVLGVLTIVGLASALVGDGIWDALSALALGAVWPWAGISACAAQKCRKSARPGPA